MNERVPGRVLAYIPAFNEAACIAGVVTRTRACPAIHELIVVDDGSTDDTAAVAQRAGATVLRHEQNRGKGAAIATALKHFAAEPEAAFAILLDADGQHDPAEISKFVEAAQQTGASIVIGNRMNNPHDMPWLRRRVNQFTSWVTSRLARQTIPDSQCGFRLLRRDTLAVLKFSSQHFETETEMLIQTGRAGRNIVSVPIASIYDPTRASRIRPCRDTIRFFRLAYRYWLSKS